MDLLEKEIIQNKVQLIGKFYIKTYGCQMNDYDSQKMAKMMHNLGLAKCDEIKEADLIIINTCHIREKATEKLYSELGRIRDVKKPQAKVVVAGCVAQAEGEEVMARSKIVNLIVGPQSIHLLPDLVEKSLTGLKFNSINLDFPGADKFDELTAENYNETIVSNLTIQEGCDKFCKFCCVPYTRGAEYSRPVEAIYREALTLVSNGAKAINLLGQNVNAYHGQDSTKNEYNLGQLLLNYVSKIEGLKRIFYTTSHPNDMHEELYQAHRDIPNLMPFVHLPIQSGSDKILKDMNRKHNRDEYFAIIDRLREVKPGMQFSTDIIVGYPGETDQDFEDTYNLVERVKFAQGYYFKYSPRPGTPAANRLDQIPLATMNERLQRLKKLFDAQQLEINQSMIGKEINVLFEKENQNGQFFGRSDYMQLVFLPKIGDENLIGQMLKVKIISAFGHSLLASQI